MAHWHDLACLRAFDLSHAPVQGRDDGGALALLHEHLPERADHSLQIQDGQLVGVGLVRQPYAHEVEDVQRIVGVETGRFAHPVLFGRDLIISLRQGDLFLERLQRRA